MLIVFGGRPGVGKTTVAREVVRRWPCAYLRMDSIEQALMTVKGHEYVGIAGYVVAYEIARSNLALGIDVVADCVNPLADTRDAWRAVASSTSSAMLEVEIVCSDPMEHRRRLEDRQTEGSELALSAWKDLLQREYDAWHVSQQPGACRCGRWNL